MLKIHAKFIEMVTIVIGNDRATITREGAMGGEDAGARGDVSIRSEAVEAEGVVVALVVFALAWGEHSAVVHADDRVAGGAHVVGPCAGHHDGLVLCRGGGAEVA